MKLLAVLALLSLLVMVSISAKASRPLLNRPVSKGSADKKKSKSVRFTKNLSDQEDEPSVFSTTMEKLSEFLKYEATVLRNVAKSALDVVSVKHVSFLQILGKWKIYQDITMGEGEDVLSYPVSVELFEDGTIKTSFNGVESTSPFKFTERQWPQKCSIEFELKSLTSSENSGAAPLLYKGYFKRSMLNNLIVIMKGKLYKTTGKSFWKQTKCVGKFKATKRRYS